jgi:hypothetical protein
VQQLLLLYSNSKQRGDAAQLTSRSPWERQPKCWRQLTCVAWLPAPASDAMAQERSSSSYSASALGFVPARLQRRADHTLNSERFKVDGSRGNGKVDGSRDRGGAQLRPSKALLRAVPASSPGVPGQPPTPNRPMAPFVLITKKTGAEIEPGPADDWLLSARGVCSGGWADTRMRTLVPLAPWVCFERRRRWLSGLTSRTRE